MNSRMILRALPLVLTIASTVGVAVTGYLAAKGGKKAEDILETKEKMMELDRENLPLKEELKHTWKCYLPAVVTGALTAGCGIASRRLDVKEIAVLTGSCGYLAVNRKKLEDRAKSFIGEERLQKIKNEVTGEFLGDKKTPNVTVEATGNGQLLCFDAYSGRQFRSSKEAVDEGLELLKNRWDEGIDLSVNDYYDALDIYNTHFGHQFGWFNDPKYCDGPLVIETHYGDDKDFGEPVYVIEILTYPMEDWLELAGEQKGGD